MKAFSFWNFDFRSRNLIYKTACNWLKWVVTVGLKWIISEKITLQIVKRGFISWFWKSTFLHCKCFLCSADWCLFKLMESEIWSHTLKMIDTQRLVSYIDALHQSIFERIRVPLFHYLLISFALDDLLLYNVQPKKYCFRLFVDEKN